VPIIEIWTLPPDGEPRDVPAALSTITTRVADFLGEAPGGTWAILHPIAPGHYAEGTDTPVVQPRETHPALVRVFAKRAADDVPALLAVTGAAVTEAFGLDEGNVVVQFEPARDDRMFWG
jgi:phenylpyruvate tautomerase PptA (4-oxalocrotonate tautomerase family)